jgi:hypothetical protein
MDGFSYWCALVISHFGSVLPTGAPDSQDVIRVAESKSIMVSKASFAVVTETRWKPRKAALSTPIETQLRISNLAGIDLLFQTCDTFGVTITSEDGKGIKPRGGRNGLSDAKPVLIPKGASYSLCRRSSLHWDLKLNGAVFTYFDGSGNVFYYGPLHPGRYKLAFWYGVSPDFLPKRHRKTNDGLGSSFGTWIGEVATNDVVVEVVAP